MKRFANKTAVRAFEQEHGGFSMNGRDLFQDIFQCRYCFSGQHFESAIRAGYKHPDPDIGQPNEPWLGHLETSELCEPTPLVGPAETGAANHALRDDVDGYGRYLEGAVVDETLKDRTLTRIRAFADNTVGRDRMAIVNMVRCRRDHSKTDPLSLKIRNTCWNRYWLRTIQAGNPKVLVLHDIKTHMAFLEQYEDHLPPEHRGRQGREALKVWSPGAMRGWMLVPDVPDHVMPKPGFCVILLPFFLYVEPGLRNRAAEKVSHACRHTYDISAQNWQWRVEPI